MIQDCHIGMVTELYPNGHITLITRSFIRVHVKKTTFDLTAHNIEDEYGS